MYGSRRDADHDVLALETPFSEAHGAEEAFEGAPSFEGDSPFAEAAFEAEESEQAVSEGFDPEGEALEEGLARCAADEAFDEAEEPEAEAWADNAGQVEFRERVLARHIALTRARKGAPLPDLRDDELALIPGTDLKTRTATAQAVGRLLAAARTALAAAQAAGDPNARRTAQLTVLSGYRGSDRQRALWRGYFKGYYNQTQAVRERLPGGPQSAAALDYMLRPKAQGGFGIPGRIAAPGYSNHQNGIAVDFGQKLTTGGWLRNASGDADRRRWRATWFHDWLKRNAAAFGFQPLATEEWHWEFQGGGSAPTASTPSARAAPAPAPAKAPAASAAGALWTFVPPGAATKVAVFVPQAAQGRASVEVLLYVHGLLGPCGMPKAPPAELISGRFGLGKIVAASGRPIVLLVPLFQSGDDRSWSPHGIDQPAALNGLISAAVADIGSRLGGAAPAISRLIVAGHSRAYGILYPLARNNAAKAMSEGPLGKLTDVWALDASYGAFPSRDFAALVAAKPGLSAQVIYRAGSSTDKFRGRAQAGRLALRPIPASVTHCAVPGHVLPKLLAGLAAPASTPESEAFEDESLAWLDFETPPAGSEAEEWGEAGTWNEAEGQWQGEADSEALEGEAEDHELVSEEQLGLEGLSPRDAPWEGEDHEGPPGRFDEFEDERDAEWEAEALESEEASPWSEADELEQESGLSGSGLTPAEQKAVEITSTLETGKRGGFYGLSGNFDGQGLSFGLVNWTIGTGSLQPLLRAFASEHPDRWSHAFGPDAARFLALIARKDKAALKAQHQFAIEEMNSCTLRKGRKVWAIREPWVTYFRRLSEDTAFQGIEIRFVRDLLRRADFWCKALKLRSEQAFCFMFDAVSSHGKWWLDKRFKDGVAKRRVLLEARLKALSAIYGEGRIPEATVLGEIAAVLGATSAPRWAEKVRLRKLWFITGQHPRAKELAGLNPSPTMPYTVSGGGGQREAQGEAFSDFDFESLDESPPAPGGAPAAKEWYELTVSGFKDSETDFSKLLARRPATERAADLKAVVDAAYEAQHENPDGAKHCAILFFGHSDRDDTAGRPPRQRVRLERERGRDRARSVAFWLKDRINERAKAAGKPQLAEWKDFSHVVIFAVSAGASELAKEPTGPANRAANRRVRMVVVGRKVRAVADRNEQVRELAS